MPKDFSLEHCKEKAYKLIDNFQGKITILNKENLNIYIEEFMQKFSVNDFYEQEKYLVWFHGKDLQMSIQLDLLKSYTDLSKLKFSMKKFMEHICTEFNEQDFFSQFEDLNELKNKIQ